MNTEDKLEYMDDTIVMLRTFAEEMRRSLGRGNALGLDTTDLRCLLEDTEDTLNFMMGVKNDMVDRINESAWMEDEAGQ